MTAPDDTAAAADWSEGYFTAAPYALAYFRDLNPHVLAQAIGGNGIAPPDTAAPFTYMELGFGRGLSLVINAAANPRARFYGIDFMPDHVGEARGLGIVGGVENLDVRQISFAALPGQDYPDFDFITLHGVWSWISAENCAHIRDFIARKLKPDGVVYLSYNAMPGWLSMLPLRELMKAEFDRASGTVEQRIDAAKRYAARLADAKAGFFAANPKALSRLKAIEGQSAAYLAHEYFNADWHVFYFRDVVATLEPLGLSYCGSAHLGNNVDTLQVKSEFRAAVDHARDVVERETLKDFVTNRQFRPDIFCRGARRSDRAALLDRVATMWVVPLVTSAEFEQLSMVTSAGKFKVQAPYYRAVMEVVSTRAMSIPELAARLEPDAATSDAIERTYRLAYILAAFGALSFALAPAVQAMASEPCRRFNDAVLGLLPDQYGGRVLASPVIGGGYPATELEFALLSAHREGGRPALNAVLKRRGISFQIDGRPLGDDAAQAKQAELYDGFVAGKLPIFRALGIAA